MNRNNKFSLVKLVKAIDAFFEKAAKIPILMALFVIGPLLLSIAISGNVDGGMVVLVLLILVAVLYLVFRKVVLDYDAKLAEEIASGTSHFQPELNIGRKKQLMAEFYEQCSKNGYTDMHNEVHSLKAKVIASDLGLHYTDISGFYQKAETCYRQVQEEREALALRKKAANQKYQEELARTSVDGELLVTIIGSKDKIRTYLRPDGSIYSCINSGPKIESRPTFTVHQGGVLQYTYNPSKTVYTGASSGNISMGGFHQTEASYTEKNVKTHTGYIDVTLSHVDFTVISISMSAYTHERFKRDKRFHEFVHGGSIRCTKSSDTADWMVHSALSGGHNIYDTTTLITAAADKKRLPFDVCQDIAMLVRRVVGGYFPPTDEELYSTACKLSEIEASAELLRSIETFQTLSDYKDASERLKTTQKKYEEVLQKEKEQTIIQKEANRKRMRKMAIIAVPVIIVGILLCSWICKRNRYLDAVELMESGEYDRATAAFSKISSFRDSEEKILEIRYLQAEALLDSDSYEEAVLAFQELNGYQDSAERILEARYLQAEDFLNHKLYDKAAESFLAIAEYSDAKARAEEAKQEKEHARLENLYDTAIWYLENQEYDNAIAVLPQLDDLEEISELLKEAIYQEAIGLLDTYNYETASDLFAALAGYKDADAYLERSLFTNVVLTESLERNGKLYSETSCTYSLNCLTEKTQVFSKTHPEYTRNLDTYQEIYSYDEEMRPINYKTFQNGKPVKVECYGYDPDGILIWSTEEFKTDSGETGSDFSHKYLYNEEGLPVRKLIFFNLYARGDDYICVDYTYDAQKNICRAEISRQSNAYHRVLDRDITYNEAGQVISFKYNTDLPVEAEWDEIQQLFSLPYTSQQATLSNFLDDVTYEYNASGKLVRQTVNSAYNGEKTTTYEYDEAGLKIREVSEILLNDIQSTETKTFQYGQVENYPGAFERIGHIASEPVA